MRTGVRRETRGNVEGDDGAAAGVDQLDRPRDLAFRHASGSRSEERVDDEVRAGKEVGRGAVVGEEPGPYPGAPELVELTSGVAPYIGRRGDQQHRRARAVALEPAGRDEAVTADASLAADDRDSRPAARSAQRRERGDDRLGGAAAGVFHEGGARDTELGDRSLIEPPHVLGGEDAQHGYRPAGSGTAWTRKSARMAM